MQPTLLLEQSYDLEGLERGSSKDGTRDVIPKRKNATT
jgi:hypothetical protein